MSGHKIEVHRSVISPPPPRRSSVVPRRRADYPHVSVAHLDVAKRLTSPVLLGPPLCDELVAFVQHIFTEEEAAVVRRLRPLMFGRTAEQVARLERRRVEDVAAILTRHAEQLGTLVRSGSPQRPKYSLMPIMPGMFEMVLIRCPGDKLTAWHRRFAELFEALYETAYAMDYYAKPVTPVVRYLPVGGTGDVHPMALPTDKLEVILDQFDAFAIGPCQCRIATRVVGRGCDKPIDNCMVMGEWAKQSAEQGIMRAVSRHEALEIKREAESHGLVNWMMNVQGTKSQSSCSCCGCCCHAMRSVNELNAPAMFAPPHFLPSFDAAKCTHCGLCARDCPMKAIVVDRGQKTWRQMVERCIGCGLCARSCQQRGAITMQPVPDYKMPYRSWFSMLLHTAPSMVSSMWRTWRGRKVGFGD